MLMRFKQFILDEGNPLSRLYMLKQKGHAMIGISGERGDKSATENKKRNKEVEAEFKKKKIGYRKTRGKWEGGSEDSFIAHSRSPSQEDKKVLKKAGKDIAVGKDQDAVMYQGGKNRQAKMIGTNKSGWPGKGKVRRVGQPQLGKGGDFETQMDRRKGRNKGRTFTTG